VGEGHTGEPQANHERLTVAQAAASLGITEGAVRSRIKRGTLPTTKEGGTVFVLLGDGTSPANQAPNTDVPGDQSELIASLQDQVRYLREQLDAEREARTEERRRHDTVVAQLTSKIPAIEAPQERPGAPETGEKEPERSEPRPATGEAQEGAELPQQRSGWLEPVDKLPWGHYVLGLLLVSLATFVAYLAPTTPALANIVANVVLVWFPPGLFGFWVGLRRRNPRVKSRVIPFGLLVGLAVSLGRVGLLVVLGTEYIGRVAIGGGAHPVYWFGFLIAPALPGWLFYVSGVLVGNARQRRSTGRLSGTISASPEPTTGWTPRQQAILGFVGTVIAALMSFVGAIFSAILASGG
jgi:hypothetical protein